MASNFDGQKVRILLVDDQPDRLNTIVSLLRQRADVKVVHPSHVVVDDLVEVDLISVDEYFDDDWFVELEGLSASLRNEDGLAVAAAFRSHARTLNKSFAVALHSGNLAQLAAGIPAASREPLTAAQHDLDWVFALESEDFGDRLIELAIGVRQALNSPSSFRDDAGTNWLGVPALAWRATAQDQIQSCRPPAHGLAENTNGRSYVRWLAQRILPFPSFLYDASHAANLLGITPASFESISEWLAGKDVDYRGPLGQFLGTRWWRAGLQSLLANTGVTAWDTSVERAKAISEAVGLELESLSFDQTVVTYDAEARVVEVGADLATSFRLNLDGWPVFADDPWASAEAIRDDPALLHMTSRLDRNSLDASA